jgi:tetratricopeptide (TPR) repeat protein
MKKAFGHIALAALLVLVAIPGCVHQPALQEPVAGTTGYVSGALAYQEGQRERAIDALQNALRDNPNLIMARFLLGNIYKDQGDYRSAAGEYEKVVELDPYVFSNHYNLGLMYHLLNELQKAAVSYLNALKLNSQDPRSNMNLGMVYTALGNPELGLPYVRRAVEIDPDSAEAAANLGVVLDTLQNYKEAEMAYRRALELDRNRIETAANLAGCLVAQKRFPEAIRVFDEIFRETDSSLLRQRYGYALSQAGRFDDSVKQYERALSLNANNFHAMNGLGDALIGQYRQSAMLDEGKRVQAVAYWKKSLELNPNQPRLTALITEYSRANLFP